MHSPRSAPTAKQENRAEHVCDVGVLDHLTSVLRQTLECIRGNEVSVQGAEFLLQLLIVPLFPGDGRWVGEVVIPCIIDDGASRIECEHIQIEEGVLGVAYTGKLQVVFFDESASIHLSPSCTEAELRPERMGEEASLLSFAVSINVAPDDDVTWVAIHGG